MTRIGLIALLVVAALAACDTGGRAEPSATEAATGASATGGAALSPPARAYVDAVAARNLDALVAAFAPDGEVVDVSRRIRGRDAIREWAGREVIGGTLRVDAVTVEAPDRQRARVHWAPAGSAGWAADYTFTVADGLIRIADLQYA